MAVTPMTAMRALRASTCLPIPESPELTRVNRQRIEAIRKICPLKGRQQPRTCRTATRWGGAGFLGQN